MFYCKAITAGLKLKAKAIFIIVFLILCAWLLLFNILNDDDDDNDDNDDDDDDDNNDNNDNDDSVMLKCPKGMVRVPGGETKVVYSGERWDGFHEELVRVRQFCIDRYEASQPDASVKSSGSWQVGQPVPPAYSQPGVIPWHSITWEKAREACVTAGKRLPTLAEWQTAFSGFGGAKWPWGDKFQSNTCRMDLPEIKHYSTGGCCFSVCKDSTCWETCDMPGSLSEWLEGFWDRGCYGSTQALSAGSAISSHEMINSQNEDPEKPGCWLSNNWAQTRYGLHNSHFSKDAFDNQGFRCAAYEVQDDDDDDNDDDNDTVCPKGMAHVPAGETTVVYFGERWEGFYKEQTMLEEYCIDRFQASQPGATSQDPGTWNYRKEIPAAQSVRGVLPWTSISWSVAKQACEKAGKRLPTLAEWQTAYSGYKGQRWPWAEYWLPNSCHIDQPMKLFPTGGCCFTNCGNGGCFEMCDMVGSLGEFISGAWDEPCYGQSEVLCAGGGFELSSTANIQKEDPDHPGCWKFESFGLQRWGLHHHPTDYTLDDDGFRCALTPGE